MKDTSSYPNLINQAEKLDNERDLYYLIFEQSLDDYSSKAESLEKITKLLGQELGNKKAQEVFNSLSECIGVTIEAKRVMLQNKEFFAHINENCPSGQKREGLDVFREGDAESEKIADQRLSDAINTHNNIMLSEGNSEACIDEHEYLYGEECTPDCPDNN